MFKTYANILPSVAMALKRFEKLRAGVRSMLESRATAIRIIGDSWQVKTLKEVPLGNGYLLAQSCIRVGES